MRRRANGQDSRLFHIQSRRVSVSRDLRGGGSWIERGTAAYGGTVVQHTCTGVGTGGSVKGTVGVEFGGTDSRVKLYAQGGLDCTLGSSALLSVSAERRDRECTVRLTEITRNGSCATQGG